MAQSVYSGLQGHGKSYEVVRGVIVPNVAKGRRVVTNVAGLQHEKIKAYCVEKLGADPAKLGDVVSVTNEDVTKPEFFPKENADNSACIVQGGDVIVIDECWRWYVTGERLPDGHLTFFRMHRHFVHPETGQACDIVLIVQAIDDLQRKVRATVEKSFLMRKHKDLGMSNRYSVTIFSGNRQTRSAITEETGPHTYSPEIFELYSSYSQSQASSHKEEAADKRGNLLNGKLFKFGIPLAVLGIVAGVWKGYSFFHPDVKPTTAVASEPGNGVPGQGAPGQPVPEKPKSDVSDNWRLVGHVVTANQNLLYMMIDGNNRVRYLSDPPAVKFSPMESELKMPNGEVVTRWSGKVAALPVPGVRR